MRSFDAWHTYVARSVFRYMGFSAEGTLASGDTMRGSHQRVVGSAPGTYSLEVMYLVDPALWSTSRLRSAITRRGHAASPSHMLLACVLCALAACHKPSVATGHITASDRWWRGNTHTHTLWSDGDDIPELVADWYKRNGYHFLAITTPSRPRNAGFEFRRRVPLVRHTPKYRERFDTAWVEERLSGDTLFVRLKRFPEYRATVKPHATRQHHQTRVDLLINVARTRS